MRRILKYFIVLLVMVFTVTQLAVCAKEKKVEEVHINAELEQKINSYENQIKQIYNQQLKNERFVALMFFDIYDLYDEVVENEVKKETTLPKAGILDFGSSKYTNSLSWYDSSLGKHYYVSVKKDYIADFQKLRYNADITYATSGKLVNDVETDVNLVKANKDVYTKYDLKAIKRVHKIAKHSYRKAKAFSEAVSAVAQNNKIEYVKNPQNKLYAYPTKYSVLPNRTHVENTIIEINKKKYNDYQVKYYEKVYSLRKEIIPVLADLLLTTEEKKQLELKKNAIFVQSKNLSEVEKDAQTAAVLEAEETSIIKALESQDINQRINKFNDEQKKQYAFVYKKLGRIFEEDVKFMYNGLQDLNNTLQNPSSSVSNDISREERIYIRIIDKRSMGSSKIIDQKLREVNNTKNVEKDLNSATTQKKSKNKKAKKVDLDEID